MPWAGAAATVVLEPLLMAAAALILGTVAAPQSQWWLQGVIAVAVLIGVHPKFLNPLLKKLGRSKLKSENNLQRKKYIPKRLLIMMHHGICQKDI